MTTIPDAELRQRNSAMSMIRYRMDDCRAEAFNHTGTHFNVYHESKLTENGYAIPSRSYISFFDTVARWDGTKLVSLYQPKAGGYSKADLDEAEARGWNAALDGVAEAVWGARR